MFTLCRPPIVFDPDRPSLANEKSDRNWWNDKYWVPVGNLEACMVLYILLHHHTVSIVGLNVDHGPQYTQSSD